MKDRPDWCEPLITLPRVVAQKPIRFYDDLLLRYRRGAALSSVTETALKLPFYAWTTLSDVLPVLCWPESDPVKHKA